jgi:phenylacetate-CoA ligase
MDERFWNKETETISRKKLEELQLSCVNWSLKQALHSRYYRKAFKDLPSKISSLNELKNFPFTSKADLRENFPDGFLAVPRDETVRLHSSSGTTGNPTVVYHTAEDIADWADLVARCLYMIGVRKSDVFQNTMGYGLFTGGLGLHYGAERLGTLTMPVGAGNSKRQLWFMKNFGTTVTHILPSYALHLHTYLGHEDTCKLEDLKLRIAIIGAEPHTNEIRKQIEKLYNIRAFNCYGLSEICGPGVAFECPEQDGLHVWEDFCTLEIIDPDTGKVLPEGEEGEMVLTTLKRHAMPLIRYRTRDLTRILPGACPCGRTHKRIARIKGRSDDMLIINGVNIFPMQIEQTLLRLPEAGGNYLVEVRKENFMDKLSIHVELNPNFFAGTLDGLEKLQKRITDDLRAELGLNCAVRIVEPHSLPVAEGKAKRVVDLRNKPGE